MPEKPCLAPKVQIFRPRDYDRDVIQHTRELIRFAKQVLIESDPAILLGWHKAHPSSENQSDPPSESQ